MHMRLNGKEYNGDDVLFKVIDLVGVDKVKSMNITSTRSIPLVIDINEGKLPAGYKHYNEKFAVHTKTPTPEKAQQIKDILGKEKLYSDVAIRIIDEK